MTAIVKTVRIPPLNGSYMLHDLLLESGKIVRKVPLAAIEGLSPGDMAVTRRTNKERISRLTREPGFDYMRIELISIEYELSFRSGISYRRFMFRFFEKISVVFGSKKWVFFVSKLLG